MGGESLLGIPMRVVATLLIGFLLFAVGLQVSGGGKFFIDLALCLLGRVRGGTAKVSVMASALFGSISGSTIGNILSTGSFTIPTMKKAGYSSDYAAAVETCASTGGVLMPPIMGATAFLIAQFLGIPYIEVCIAAAVPSFLFYLGLFVQIDGYAAKSGIKSLPKESIPSFKSVLREGWFYIFSFALLVILLFYMKMEGQAPFLALAFIFISAMVYKKLAFSLNTFIDFFI